MTLLPLTCDLSLETVLKHLNLTEEVIDTVQPFQYEVIKNDTSVYLVKIVLQKLIVQPSILNITLSHLNATIIIPQTPVEPTENIEPEDQEDKGDQPIEEDKANEIDPPVQAPAEATQSVAALIGGSIIGAIALGASSTVWALVSFQQFIGYFIYINVHYPSQVEMFLSMLQTSFWDYLPNPLSYVTEPLLETFLKNNDIKATKFQPPQKFVRYEKTSFFIENGEAIIAMNIMLLVILAIILFFKSIPRFQNKVFLRTVKVYLRWNIITRTFLENGLPLSLAICLQLRILIFNGAYLMACTIFSIISILYMAIMIIFMIRVLYKRENDLLKKGLIKRIYGTLHEGVILKKSSSKYFHIVILFRGLLLVCLVTLFDDSPKMQIILLIFFNIGLVYYMIREVPFEDKKFDVITKAKEVFILLGEIGILLLMFKTENKTYYEVVGWFIASVFGTAFFMELGYLIILQIIGFKQIKNHFVQLWNNLYSYFKSFCPSKSEIKPQLFQIKSTRTRFESCSSSMSEDPLKNSNLYP